MKPWLVDVPVRVMIWTRPDCQRQQFDVLKQARPSTLFLISDGGRNEKEWTAIYENRKMFEEEIDWDCKIYKLYESSNQGMYTIATSMHKLIWDNADRCVFIEDDQIPSVSFFRYCAEMLEKYKDDTRVHIITGMNHMGDYKDVEADYFFSRVGSIWGIARWKPAPNSKRNFKYGDDKYIMKTLLKNARNNKKLCRGIKGYYKGELVDGHVASGEFWNNLAPFSQNQLFIVPKKNMIRNIGCTDNAAHAKSLKKMPKVVQKMFNMQTYEIGEHVNHPGYVIPDYFYEKYVNRILGINHPVLTFFRRCESMLRSIYYGDGKHVFKKIIKKIKREKKYEK